VQAGPLPVKISRCTNERNIRRPRAGTAPGEGDGTGAATVYAARAPGGGTCPGVVASWVQRVVLTYALIKV